MRAILKAKIIGVETSSEEVILELNTLAPGKVEVKSLNAQDIYLKGKIRLKALIANDMKIGAPITITISDEEV